MNQTRRAFQEAAPTPTAKKLELNLDNKRSLTEQLPKPLSREDGQKVASETNARLNSYAEQAAKLALSFKQVLNDKTLPINKSVIARDAEKGLIMDLAALGTAINNDSREKEGEGSMGAILLLLGTVLAQRDKLNELAYADEQHAKRIIQLEKQTKFLETQINMLDAQAKAMAIDKPKASG